MSFTYTANPSSTSPGSLDLYRVDSTTGQKTKISTGTPDSINPIVAGNAPAPAVATSNEPSAFSSVKGSNIIDQSKKTADKLSGVTTPPTPTTSNPNPPTPPANNPTPPSATQTDTVTLINPDTEQKITFNNASINKASIQSYLNSGYTLSEANGNIPDWLTPTKSTGASGTSLDDANAALTTAKSDLDTAKAKLTSFDVSNDPALQSILGNVSSQWDTRIADMQRANDSRAAAINTTGIRLGSQFTGGAGGMFGSILSAEEKDAISRIATLQSQKQQALTDAKTAYENQQWDRYAKLVDLAQKTYEDQLTSVSALNKATVEANQKIQERADQSERDNVIASFVKNGVTDPVAILKAGNKLGYNLTADDVNKGLTNLGAWVDNQKDIADIVKKVGANGAPASIIDAVTKAGNLADAVTAAGDYLQDGSGTVGEYLYYKRTAIAAGQKPVDFNTYQTMDANRKAKATAGADASRVLTVTEAQALGVPFGTTAGNAYGTIPKKPATDANNRANIYATRAVTSAADIARLSDTVSGMDAATFATQMAAEPNSILNGFVSDDIRQQAQAERNFVTAVLRQESGAAISPSEFATDAKKYFPRPGDDPQTLKQKTQARADAISGLIKEAGSAYEPPAATGDDLVKSETDAQAATIKWVTDNAATNPNAAAAVKNLKANGTSYTDIYQYLKVKGYIQ